MPTLLSWRSFCRAKGCENPNDNRSQEAGHSFPRGSYYCTDTCAHTNGDPMVLNAGFEHRVRSRPGWEVLTAWG